MSSTGKALGGESGLGQTYPSPQSSTVLRSLRLHLLQHLCSQSHHDRVGGEGPIQDCIWGPFAPVPT